MTTSIKGVVVDAEGSAPIVRSDLPAPTPGPGEVLVRVHASSANPVDNAIAAGMLVGMIEHEFPVTLGRDYAGVVEEVGADVTNFAPGDEVFGFVSHADPTVHKGSWAEVITLPQDAGIARKPGNVDLATAGAAALTGITAMTLVDALEPGGRVASPNSAAGDGPGRTNVMAEPSTENLERLAGLLDAGTLKLHIQDSYDLDRAAEALQALGSTHTRGKLGIRVT